MSSSYKNNKVTEQRLKVLREFVQKVQSVARAIWIKISPKNPPLKAAMVIIAVPLVLIAIFLGLALFTIVLISLGFIVFALAQMARTSEQTQNNKETIDG